MSENITDLDPLSILTTDLSDPKLTAMPVLAAGTYEGLISKARIVTNDAGMKQLRYNLTLTTPAFENGGANPWPAKMPVGGSLLLTPTGGMTIEKIKANAAKFCQAIGEQTIAQPAQVEAIQRGEKEVLLPHLEGKRLTFVNKVKPDKDTGELRNNVEPLLPRR